MKSNLSPGWKQKCSLYSGILLNCLKKVLTFPLILLVKCYQLCISPFTPPSCRFTPTCSQYALEALRRHGPVKGLCLAVWRFLRCNPWGGSGYDPVP
ncbi:MAG: membrane protein insertion efficiency factor YidD [Bacteroidales bacterium]|nr:membrane protein insertion efficiency factor YidD [Bacteroidales bacterium]HPJ82670.1 membrane protein insertion efficiency factor YidD [Bacteroidales bacterium]